MRDGSGLRWWPAVVVLALLAGFLVRSWWLVDQTRQDKVMQTMAATALALLLLLIWFVLASRAAWKGRLAVLGAALVVAAAASQILTIRGVSGDLVPIVGFKRASDQSAGLVGSGGTTGLEPLDLDASGDYPQFLGPARNATAPGVRLDPDWRASPPREVWRREVGAGWSGFAVKDARAVTQEQHGAEEQVVAYDLATGEVLWRHADAARYETTIGGTGPRATPTIADDAVYTLGATGILNALDLATGRRFWSRDILKEHGAANREWGKSGSPLVVGERVVVSAGGGAGKSLVAYDRATGDLAWAAGTDTSSYSSPVLLELAGRRQILMRNQHSMTAHDPETGTILWTEGWPAEQPNVAVPLAVGSDRVLVSSGYGVGAKLYRVSRASDGLDVSTLWESPRMKAKFTNLIVHEGFVYGLDDGVMVCLDPVTGERRWKKGRYGHGQVILAGDLLLVTTEHGEVVLIEPNPEELRELGSLSAFDGKTWNPPALAGSLLLLRTDREAALYALPAAAR